MRRVLAVSAIVGGLVALGAAASLRDRPALEAGGGLRVLSVSGAPVVLQGHYAVARFFVGRVEARRESALGFELEGKVARVLVDEGEEVAAGDALAKLDLARLEARRRELQAELRQRIADVELAVLTLARRQGLALDDAISKQSLDEAREGHDGLKAGVALSRARIASLDLEMEKSTLYAPFYGVITRRGVDEGQVVAAGMEVLVIQEGGALEARVGVAGAVASALRAPAYPLEVNGVELTASVRAIIPMRRASTRTVDVVFDLPETSGVRPGDLVTLRVDHQVREQGIWVPVSALTEGRRGLWMVYVAVPLPARASSSNPGPKPIYRVETRLVEIIHQTDDQAFVKGTLKNGDFVVTTGLHRIVPGQQVSVVDPQAEGTG